MIILYIFIKEKLVVGWETPTKFNLIAIVGATQKLI